MQIIQYDDRGIQWVFDLVNSVIGPRGEVSAVTLTAKTLGQVRRDNAEANCGMGHSAVTEYLDQFADRADTDLIPIIIR